MQGILATIQTSCAELLAASPALAGVQILHEQIGDVESRVRIALAKSTGICAIVLTPSASGNSPASPGPHLDSMEVVVEVAENVVLNQSAAGTRLPASAVAEQVAATLHHRAWMAGKTLVFTSIRLMPQDGLVVYRVGFATSATIRNQDQPET
jgi:hypothetical protein